ncbi:sigma-54 interaction domain-containing protein [Neobacillus niacini]|uniref:sigma-54 interaction domain-containing protein n=1 Tax=Neobacillus niacini TaxID=86668 RepID=UPI00069444B1|nr:sigma-54-dependent Fis family transcriptional regulator [Neobacillus niacini]
MIGTAICSLIRSFTDGVIMLNSNLKVHCYETEKIGIKVINGKHIAEFFPSVPDEFLDNKTFTLTINQRKLFVTVKILPADDNYIILCIEDVSDLINNSKMRLYCLEKIIESLDEGVMMSNEDGVISLYNLAQEKMEGLNRQAIIGKHLWDAYNYDNHQKSEHRHTFKTGKPIFSRYKAHSTINGVPKYVNYNTYPIQKDNETIAVFSLSTNESRLKDMLYQTIEQKRKITEVNHKDIDRKNGTNFTFEDIKGQSLVLQNLIKEAQNIAIHNTDVLIVGETGTGKELFAQSIHNHSPNAKSPFIAINCAAIPETLLESTLFGTVKGAFTGATNQVGLFEHAKDGTLFLDEINSMPITLQSKLMRVLQERLVRRVGSNEVTSVTCRVISASNEDPEKLISEGKMRVDLFYRIARTSLFIPPLRERAEDIHFFIDYFINKFKNKFNKSTPHFSKHILKSLLQYHWPGNTRELEHSIENVIIRVSENDEAIELEHLPSYIRRKLYSDTKDADRNNKKNEKQPLKSMFSNSQEHFILKTLEQTDWNISKAARKLGITRQSLQYHIKKYGMVKTNN